jgi:hypothetical protein
VNAKFKQLLKDRIQAAQTESLFAIALFAGFILFFVYWGFKSWFLFIPAIIFTVIAYFVYKKFQGDFKGPDFWIDMLNENPANIVWIKPITVKHTVGFVITLYSEQKFQILTAENMAVTIKCDKAGQAEVFLKGCQEIIPNSHIGYTSQIKSIYLSDPANFIAKLKSSQLYSPIGG